MVCGTCRKFRVFFFNWVLNIKIIKIMIAAIVEQLLWSAGEKSWFPNLDLSICIHQSPGELLTWSTHLSLFILCPRVSSVTPLQLLFVFVYNISFHLLLDMAKGFNYTTAWLANDKASLWVTLTGLLLESHLWITHTDSSGWTPQDVINIKSPRENSMCKQCHTLERKVRSIIWHICLISQDEDINNKKTFTLKINNIKAIVVLPDQYLWLLISSVKT